jgi:hypothetical protein
VIDLVGSTVSSTNGPPETLAMSAGPSLKVLCGSPSDFMVLDGSSGENRLCQSAKGLLKTTVTVLPPSEPFTEVMFS